MMSLFCNSTKRFLYMGLALCASERDSLSPAEATALQDYANTTLSALHWNRARTRALNIILRLKSEKVNLQMQGSVSARSMHPKKTTREAR
jgi:hypothetical protein